MTSCGINFEYNESTKHNDIVKKCGQLEVSRE